MTNQDGPAVGTRVCSTKLKRFSDKSMVDNVPLLSEVLVHTAGIKPAHIDILVEGALERQKDRPISEVVSKLTAWA